MVKVDAVVNPWCLKKAGGVSKSGWGHTTFFEVSCLEGVQRKGIEVDGSHGV